MPTERALTLIKPDGVAQGIVGACIHRWEKRGLKLLACRMMIPTAAMIREQYFDKQTERFFDELLAFMTSGPCVACAWQGVDANARVRQVIGSKDPLGSEAGTIRGEYGAVDPIHSLVHGSRTVEEAEAELPLWFPEQFTGPPIPGAKLPPGSQPYGKGQLVRPYLYPLAGELERFRR